MDDFFPDLVAKAKQLKQAKAPAVSLDYQIEQHADHIIENRKVVLAVMAKYEPQRLQCELREIQRKARIAGSQWLEKHWTLVAQYRGQEACIKLRTEFYDHLQKAETR